MKKISKIIPVLSGFPANVNILLGAILVSNIGNGIQTIAMSKWLYDKTGSAFAYGGVILLDYLVSFLIQFLSGAVIDRTNPKKTYIICDLIRGTVLILMGISLHYPSFAIVAVSLSVAVISMVNSIYRSCYFKLLPMLIDDPSQLLKINGIYSTVIQTGLLIGVGIVAPVLTFWNASTAIIINGITFIISSIIVMFIRFEYAALQNEPTKKITRFFRDWGTIFTYLRKDKSLIWHILISSGDIMVVNFFNILLVPMVTIWYFNNAYDISLFDGSFTVGAILIGIFISKFSNKLGLRLSSWLGLTIQGLMFLLLCINRITIVSVAIILFMGVANGYSGLIFQTSLQNRIGHELKGRIASFKNLVISILSLILIPIVSKFLDISITSGLICSAVIILIFGLSSFIINKLRIYGDNYITNRDNT